MKKISMLLVFVMAVSLLLPCILNTDAYALDKIYCPPCSCVFLVFLYPAGLNPLP